MPEELSSRCLADCLQLQDMGTTNIKHIKNYCLYQSEQVSRSQVQDIDTANIYKLNNYGNKFHFEQIYD